VLPAQHLLREGALAIGRFQRVDLQDAILILSRDPGIADGVAIAVLTFFISHNVLPIFQKSS